MRIHSHIWVSAFLRQVEIAGASAMLARRGEASAGAIYIKICTLDGKAQLFSPAPLFEEVHGIDRAWYCEFGSEPKDEREVDDYLRSQGSFDSDIWIVEIEDREGRHFLGDQVTEL